MAHLTPSPTPTFGDAYLADLTVAGSAADWATAIVALIALVLSALAMRNSYKSQRQLTLVALDERLGSAETAAGRRVLYGINSEGDARRLLRWRSGTWDRANHAVNLWNKLAQYAQNGWVDSSIATRLWGDTVVDAWPHLVHVIRFRRSLDRPDKWSSLVWFASAAGASVPPDLQPPQFGGKSK